MAKDDIPVVNYNTPSPPGMTNNQAALIASAIFNKNAVTSSELIDDAHRFASVLKEMDKMERHGLFEKFSDG